MTEENIERATQSKLKSVLAEIVVLIIVQGIAIISFYGYISEFYKPVTFTGIDTSKYHLDTPYLYAFFSFLAGFCLSYYIAENFRERYLISNAQTKSYDLFFGRPPSNLSPLFGESFSRKTLYIYFAVTFFTVFFVGMIIFLNGYWDKSPPQEYLGHVTDRYEVYHRSGTSYKAVFDIPVTSHGHVLHSSKQISKETYERLEIGVTPVEFTLRDGFFGMQWVEKAHIKLPENSWNKSTTQKNNFDKSLVEWRVPSAEMAIEGDGGALSQKWPNGTTMQIEPTLNGKRHGMAHYWFDNGQKYGDIPWWQGEKHGRFKLYREDGSLEQNLSYKNGQVHGLLCWYDTQGNTSNRELYKDGKVVSTSADLPDCP